MSDWWSLAQHLSLTSLGFTACVALALAWWMPRWLLPRLRAVPAQRRGGWLQLLAAAPPLVGLLLSILCLVPSALSGLWPSLDHCMEHGDHHVHLCLHHGGEVLPGLAWLLPLGLATGWGLWVALRWAALHLRSRRALDSLARLATPDQEEQVLFLEADSHVAFVAGLLRPRIFMGRALWEQLSAPQRAWVLAHERAHVRRRDNLRRAMATLLSCFHLPRARRQLLEELELSCEQACDADITTNTQERLLLAQTLLHLGRLMSQPPTQVAATFGATDHLPARVHALLRDDQAPAATSVSLKLWRAAASLAVVALLINPLHHATETLLSLILG